MFRHSASLAGEVLRLYCEFWAMAEYLGGRCLLGDDGELLRVRSCGIGAEAYAANESVAEISYSGGRIGIRRRIHVYKPHEHRKD